ncbi:MAG TPA: hypothetical protein DEB06_11865 [Phycisphaerales bacterium]|nr:hypothetical protein [Phycisphaerales bacterium]
MVAPVPSPRPIRQGQVYWIDDFPPLDGDRSKRRPVIVISPPIVLRRPATLVLVVAVSTSPRPTPEDHELIELPHRGRDPTTTSGLNRPSWAVPRWLLPVERSRLVQLAGYISGDTLRDLLEALDNRWPSADTP